METRMLGGLWPVSVLALGGGGLGQIWGETSRDEAVATVRAAVDAGITLFDAAPMYGRGEAEMVFGAAFDGTPPESAKFTTKCFLGSPPAEEVYSRLERSLLRSLDTLKIEQIDLFFLHSNICPDDYTYPEDGAMQHRFATGWSLYQEHVVPAFEKLKEKGLIADWGVTGTGLPKTIMESFRADPRPAVAQIVTNLLDSPGNMKRYQEPPEPRNIIRTAVNNGVGVLGIRAVQAGALTGALDRKADAAEQADFDKAAPFRTLAAELGQDPAVLAHRYALAMPGVDTVILGVKNRSELSALVDGVNEGPLDEQIIGKINALKLNFQMPRMPID